MNGVTAKSRKTACSTNRTCKRFFNWGRYHSCFIEGSGTCSSCPFPDIVADRFRTRDWVTAHNDLLEHVDARGSKEMIIVPILPHYSSKFQPWILRNLTTEGFVRSESVALKPLRPSYRSSRIQSHHHLTDSLGF